jgi:hypothetical protein
MQAFPRASDRGNKVNEIMREKLISVAKSGRVTYYSEIAPIVDLDMGNPDDRNKISNILDEISSHEHDKNRPLLSVVVIHRQDNIPGNGFFYTRTKTWL